MSDYTDLAGGQWGRHFYTVILHCSEGENVRRLTLAGRGEHYGNGKLTEVDRLLQYRERTTIYKFNDIDEIEIDVTDIKPEEAAKRVLEFVESW